MITGIRLPLLEFVLGLKKNGIVHNLTRHVTSLTKLQQGHAIHIQPDTMTRLVPDMEIVNPLAELIDISRPIPLCQLYFTSRTRVPFCLSLLLWRHAFAMIWKAMHHVGPFQKSSVHMLVK